MGCAGDSNTFLFKNSQKEFFKILWISYDGVNDIDTY